MELEVQGSDAAGVNIFFRARIQVSSKNGLIKIGLNNIESRNDVQMLQTKPDYFQVDIKNGCVMQ